MIQFQTNIWRLADSTYFSSFFCSLSWFSCAFPIALTLCYHALVEKQQERWLWVHINTHDTPNLIHTLWICSISRFQKQEQKEDSWERIRELEILLELTHFYRNLNKIINTSAKREDRWFNNRTNVTIINRVKAKNFR